MRYSTSSASNCDSATDHGAATNRCGATISDRPAANYGGAAIANGPTRRNATSAVYTTGADDCTRFYSAHNDKTCDQAEDYDHVPHVSYLRVDLHYQTYEPRASQVCMESGKLPTVICGYS